MYAGRDFDPSDTGENETYTFDLVNDLAATGETITSAAWTCAVVSGVDANAATCVFGSATISGTQTSQRINGLKPGVVYRLQVKAVTSLGNTVSLYSHVKCANPK